MVKCQKYLRKKLEFSLDAYFEAVFKWLKLNTKIFIDTMSEQIKIAPRKTEPVFYLEKLQTEDLQTYKDYFNNLNANNRRPELFGHEPFYNNYWYPFPFMFHDPKYKDLYQLPHLAKLKYVYELSIPLFTQIERLFPDHCMIKLEINLMPPGTIIKPHVDKWGVMSNCIRIHIPIQTNESVVFKVDGEEYNIPEGQIFEFNNQISHSVENKGSNIRIHYVFDLAEKDSLKLIEKEILNNGLTKFNHISYWQKKIRKEWQ